MPRKSYTPGHYRLAVRKARAGKGLFAVERIPKGAVIIEYTGKLLSDEEYNRSRSRYLFDIGKDRVIDGWQGGSNARYINHSCLPNCEADNRKGRIFIRALRRIEPGEELAYHYGEDYFERILKDKCRCPKCMPERAA